ncbi:transmembrane emp24 domain-containing protein p24beta3-like [Andrographis paniculata]|uniref:transmembrane emp24 domain-containing protein p24beta3-like n=1 Tax=Andrographis paniculata TaxID=175694 RepID=UPI0021E81E6F|nr:transmembrane emp24 domain-containing protein p24beta3-like [Andrographis paniculata]
MEATATRIIRSGGGAWAVVALLLVSLISRTSALTVTVKDVECVYEYVYYKGDTVTGNFVVDDVYWDNERTGSMDFIATTPDGTTVHTVKASSGDKFEFKAPVDGMYKFCFHNHYHTPEAVSFNIHVGHIPNEHNIAKDEHLDPINTKLAELKESLESVTLEQKYLRARDARHRHTNESTRKRVINYTIGEYVLLAVMSGLQVFYIRRLFSKTVPYGRV